MKIILLKISMVIFTFIVIVYGIKIRKKDELSLNTVSLPSTKKTIVIDAGHGLPDEGAVGVDLTTEEKINLIIAMKLQKLIESVGSNAVITRNGPEGIYDEGSNTIRTKKVSDIKNRVKIVNNNNADILISIHLNKYPDNSCSGWQTFYKKNSVESKVLANCIQNALKENINKNNHRTPKEISNVYLIDKSKIPSAIVECGFISNRSDTEKLKSDEYQDKIAWGIFIGIQEYFKTVC